MPFESEKFPAQISAVLVGLKRPQELLGWYNEPEGNCAPPSTPVTASAIPWWLWHRYWSFVERWHIFGAGHSRTLRHDWHGYPSRQGSELSQDVLAMDSDIWGACDLSYVLVPLYASP